MPREIRSIVQEILRLNPTIADLQSAMYFKKKILGKCTQQGCNSVPLDGHVMCKKHTKLAKIASKFFNSK